MTRSKIGLIIVASLIVVVGPIAYVCLFGFQTMMALEARYIAHKSPDAWQTPVRLPDMSISRTPHQKISYFGYELELPWDDVDETKGKTSGPIHVTVFRSGNAFWFSTLPAKSFVNDVMKGTKLDPDQFRRVYGDEAAESDYAFHRVMLQTTPESVSPFMSRPQAVKESQLLLFKVISMPPTDSGIFDIRAPGFRGFQFAFLEGPHPKIIDDLFSDDGGLEVMFFPTAGGPVPSITQPEINRVLQSIHKLPAPSPSAPSESHP